MRNELKSNIQAYIENLLPSNSEAEVLSRNLAADLGLGGISLSDMEAEILRFMITLRNPKKIVEIGTLTGLTTLKMASRMGSASEIWTLEKSEVHGKCAQQAFDLLPTDLRNRIHLILGDARVTLSDLVSKGPFEFAFIDGNKSAYLDYAHWCEKNMTAGALVMADNVFLGGKVFLGSEKTDKQTQVMNQFNQYFFQSENWDASIFPTAEGLLIARKRS
ncbi:MAG: O-methyltransferase [Pseudobdellovibrionaceae bacterium]